MIKPTNKKKELDKKYNKLPNFFSSIYNVFPFVDFIHSWGEWENNITFIIGAWAASLPPVWGSQGVPREAQIFLGFNINAPVPPVQSTDDLSLINKNNQAEAKIDFQMYSVSPRGTAEV